jgi:hypothetical protein
MEKNEKEQIEVDECVIGLINKRMDLLASVLDMQTFALQAYCHVFEDFEERLEALEKKTNETVDVIEKD